jgi:hypothetical protein
MTAIEKAAQPGLANKPHRATDQHGFTRIKASFCFSVYPGNPGESMAKEFDISLSLRSNI